MTSRDTHALRLEHWPRLSTFPTTAGVIVTAIALDLLTFAAWAFLATLFLLRADNAADALAACKAAGAAIPDGWFLFLAGLHSIGTAHFGIKRKTHDPTLPQNGGAGA